MLLTATHGHPKKITKKQKIITNFKDNLTSQKPRKNQKDSKNQVNSLGLANKGVKNDQNQ